MRPTEAAHGYDLCVRLFFVYLCRKLDTAGRLEWLNIREVESKSTLDALCVRKEDALSQLHVFEHCEGAPDSRLLHKGVDAFPAIWDRLPYFVHLSPVWRFSLSNVPGVRAVVEWAYRKFVFSKFRKWMSSKAGAKLKGAEGPSGVPACNREAPPSS